MVLYNSIRRYFAVLLQPSQESFWWNNPFGVTGEREACLASITDIFAAGMYIALL